MMEFSRMTILAADLGLFDFVQGWDLIAHFAGFGFLAIPAAIASALSMLFTVWIIIHGSLKLASKICMKIATTMEAIVNGIINKFFGSIAEIAKGLFAWARGKMKK